jgi:chloramphenicol O-acetyltransferase type A
MRYIDLETWPRKEHFMVFKDFDFPHFNLCTNVDITKVYPFIKQNEISFNLAVIFLITRSANAIPEFRYRILDGKLVEFDTIHPSSTIMGVRDVFSFCTMEYHEDFSMFVERATLKIASVKKRPRLLEEDQNRNDLFFMTAVPWISFTSFMHPLKMYPSDSVPRCAWGKFFEEGESLKLPLSVQAHHAVMDGLHLGQFYEHIQVYLDRPELVFG